MAVGLLGEYLARIYDEVKQRPLYIVKRRVGDGIPAESAGRRRVEDATAGSLPRVI